MNTNGPRGAPVSRKSKGSGCVGASPPGRGGAGAGRCRCRSASIGLAPAGSGRTRCRSRHRVRPEQICGRPGAAGSSVNTSPPIPSNGSLTSASCSGAIHRHFFGMDLLHVVEILGRPFRIEPAIHVFVRGEQVVVAGPTAPVTWFTAFSLILRNRAALECCARSRARGRHVGRFRDCGHRSVEPWAVTRIDDYPSLCGDAR